MFYVTECSFWEFSSEREDRVTLYHLAKKKILHVITKSYFDFKMHFLQTRWAIAQYMETIAYWIHGIHHFQVMIAGDTIEMNYFYVWPLKLMGLL